MFMPRPGLPANPAAALQHLQGQLQQPGYPQGDQTPGIVPPMGGPMSRGPLGMPQGLPPIGAPPPIWAGRGTGPVAGQPPQPTGKGGGLAPGATLPYSPQNSATGGYTGRGGKTGANKPGAGTVGQLQSLQGDMPSAPGGAGAPTAAPQAMPSPGLQSGPMLPNGMPMAQPPIPDESAGAGPLLPNGMPMGGQNPAYKNQMMGAMRGMFQ